jgi:ATP-dependent RNA helicase DeaD
MSETSQILFADLQLSQPLLRALQDVGYEIPSPIQAATIPVLLENRDVLGQAQTGTGKTAAFALPILSRLDLSQRTPQALVLAPTRELALQVAEAFQRYATHIPGFHVLPIYGGQSYIPQLAALKRGVHVVVGTPGRVIDHLDKGSLDLSKIKTLVLDEADEMLRMGFIDDVERILQETPATRQTALFSATMPMAIKRIAQTYLNKPAEITAAAKTGTADNIRQRYWLVSGMHKLDALTRILEAEEFDGMIIFSRTKLGTEELASKLGARGFSVAAINGDLQQAQRERIIGQLKDGKIDILVATDVAARGLDVERISHVINYDVPHDPESYTHRIGRTGRAGRSGEAILFITPREKGMLKMIERSTRQPISALELPTLQAVNDVRVARFKQQISATLALGELGLYQSVVEEFEREQNIPPIEIAAALAKMARGDVPLLLSKSNQPRVEMEERPSRAEPRMEHGRERPLRPALEPRERVFRAPDAGMQTYRIAVGYIHGVKPGNIVGAIANEADIDSKNIGRIEIFDDYSVLDMPINLSGDVLEQLQTVRVAGQFLRIRVDSGAQQEHTEAPKAESKPKAAAKPKAEPKADTVSKPKAEPRALAAAPAAASVPPAAASAPPAAGVVASEDDPWAAERAAKKAAKEAKAAAKLAEESKVGAVVARARAEPVAASEERSGKKKDRPAKVQGPVQSYRIEVGREHAVSPANIVGAIANEAGLEAKHIGRIDIFDTYSLIDLPQGMPNELLKHLKTVWVAGRQLHISEAVAGAEHRPAPAAPKAKKEFKEFPHKFAGKAGGDAKPKRKISKV